MDEDDRSALVEFTYRLEKDITRALEYTTFDGELRDLAWAAWSEVRDSDEFDVVRRAIGSGVFDVQLDANGLSGAQLRFKLRLVDASREAVDHEEEQPSEDEPEPRGRVRRLLRKLLGSADVIVDSLVDALTGRGEAIKELKEAVGIGLED